LPRLPGCGQHPQGGRHHIGVRILRRPGKLHRRHRSVPVLEPQLHAKPGRERWPRHAGQRPGRLQRRLRRRVLRLHIRRRPLHRLLQSHAFLLLHCGLLGLRRIHRSSGEPAAYSPAAAFPPFSSCPTTATPISVSPSPLRLPLNRLQRVGQCHHRRPARPLLWQLSRLRHCF